MSGQATLVVLAAGIGSRYGGIKQMEPVGPSGEFLLEYSIYDAIRAGFANVVCVVNRGIADDFRDVVGRRVARAAHVEYVLQELRSAVPRGFDVPPARTKPWGTGHAVLVCANAVKGPFGVINADDFYGRQSYEKLAAFLRTNTGADAHALVGFPLRATLSDHGSVSRGVCDLDAGGRLARVMERTRIERSPGGAVARNDDGTVVAMSGDETVSMNMWGFSPSIFDALRDGFTDFLGTYGGDPKAEFYLPVMVDRLVNSGRATVDVLRAEEEWFGMTHADDKARVATAILRQVKEGRYPLKLWE
jgi:UTP-glucose-1-phosphate uridylyltransferase